MRQVPCSTPSGHSCSFARSNHQTSIEGQISGFGESIDMVARPRTDRNAYSEDDVIALRRVELNRG